MLGTLYNRITEFTQLPWHTDIFILQTRKSRPTEGSQLGQKTTAQEFNWKNEDSKRLPFKCTSASFPNMENKNHIICLLWPVELQSIRETT